MKESELKENLIDRSEYVQEEKFSQEKASMGKASSVPEREEKEDENDVSDDEEEVRNRLEIETLNKEIKRKDEMNRANNKVFVGSGFSFDMTEFFTFKKKKDLASTGSDVKSVFEELTGGHLSWIILIYSVCNAAMIPAWIMSIKATKLLRISWRFLLQAIMIIPFVLYEHRIASKKGDTQTLEKYKLSYIFKLEHLQIAYLSSFATSFWFSIILTTFEWTFISQTMFLGALTNYFLSFGRTSRGKSHDLEPGGQVLITLGILIVLIDIYNFNPEDALKSDWDYINPFYLTRTRFQSILAGFAALGVSYGMSKFSVYTNDLKNHYPPYLSMLIVNSLVCLNMMLSTYFFNGATFDYHSSYGILSIFSQQHFAAFMYMAIILCMGMVISFVMISNLFPDPIIPSLAMTYEPAISTLLVYMAGVQNMPNSLSFIGYILIIPGNCLILIGQRMYQLANEKKQQEDKEKVSQLQQEIEKRQKSLRKIPEVLEEENKVEVNSVRSGSFLKKDTINEAEDYYSHELTSIEKEVSENERKRKKKFTFEPIEMKNMKKMEN